MSLNSFEARRFRNLSRIQITPSPLLNIIYGNNGSGKTSLVEALYYLGRLRSFRTPYARHLIQKDQEDFVCVGKSHIPGNKNHIIGIQRKKEEQIIRLDSEPLHRASDIAALLPLQIINNDIHQLIEGGPSERRHFLDWGVFHVEPMYAGLMKTFRHTLKQRNAALKKRWQKQAIKHWDTALAEQAENINHLRQKYIEQLQPKLDRILEDSFNLPKLKMSYFPGWDTSQQYCEVLEQGWLSDQEKGTTQSGPHRADIKLRSENRALKEVVSRGQQKIIATLMVLAQIELHREQTERPLVLLVDDLPAELDEHFGAYFMEKILATESQIFITTTHYNLLKLPKDYLPVKVFHVEHGNIEEVTAQVFPDLVNQG